MTTGIVLLIICVAVFGVLIGRYLTSDRDKNDQL